METINPKNFSEIDISTIEYLTLKNGNIILLDSSAPIKNNISANNNIENSKIPKFIALSIANTINITYNSVLLNEKYKHNNKTYKNKIVKNENLFFQAYNQINSMPKLNISLNYNKNDLNSLRNKIDEIDNIIMKSFIERLKVVKDINNYKIKHNLPILDEEREKELLSKRKQMLTDNSLNNYIENLFKLILDISKHYQNKEKNDLNSKLINNINLQDYNHDKYKEKNILKNNIPKINKLNLNNINNNTSDLIPIQESNDNLNSENSKNNERGGGVNIKILERREKRLKTLEEKFKIKENKKRGRNKNLINSVCSLNIPSDIPRNINLIEKFNKIVDKLNDQKIKSHQAKKDQEDKEHINKKHYQVYKILKNEKIPKGPGINTRNKNELKKNIFNLCDRQHSKEFSSFHKENKPNIIFNKTRIFDIRKNIDESKIKKMEQLKTSRTSSSKNRFAKYRRNHSSIVLPSNSYYH